MPWLEEKLTRDYEHSGWVINGQQTMKELNRAYDEIEAQCKPLEDLEIIKALIKLKTLTASRAASNEDYDIGYFEGLRAAFLIWRSNMITYVNGEGIELQLQSESFFEELQVELKIAKGIVNNWVKE